LSNYRLRIGGRLTPDTLAVLESLLQDERAAEFARALDERRPAEFDCETDWDVVEALCERAQKNGLFYSRTNRFYDPTISYGQVEHYDPESQSTVTFDMVRDPDNIIVRWDQLKVMAEHPSGLRDLIPTIEKVREVPPLTLI